MLKQQINQIQVQAPVSRKPLAINMRLNHCQFFLEISTSKVIPDDVGFFPCDPSSFIDLDLCIAHCVSKGFRTGRCQQIKGRYTCTCAF
jgi:hypothetical protein